MALQGKLIASVGLVLALEVSAPCLAQELIPHGPGATVLPDRTVPPPFGVSPEMLEVVAERRVHLGLPVPTTTEEWLELQKGFDVAGEELGRQAAKHNGATYQVKEIAGVRTVRFSLFR